MTNEEYKKLSIDEFTKVAERYPDRHYTGLDLTPAMIEQARKKNIPNAEFVVGDCENFPFDENAFDVIICSNSFHHYPNPQAFFDSVKRCLRPGGRLILRDVTSDNRLLLWFMDNIELPIANMLGHGDVRAARRKTVMECCKKAGLKVEKFEIRKGMRKLVKDFLTREGYTVLEARDGMEAMDLFYEDKDIALIILDVMMPKMDGWQVCREVRETSKVPIIMLTARSEERDELQGFELGVDEYISKPFSPKILVARVNAILRRTFGTVGNDSLEAGGITVDKSAHIVKIEGTPVELSYKEFELLTYFIENQGIALSREKILNNVWNYDYFGDARTIDTHVKKLRSKLGDKGEYIKTIWGMGYKFEVQSAEK